MPSRTVTVASTSGLHARPASLFVAAAGAQPVAVTIRTGDKPAVPARSMLSVLSLGAKCGTEVILEADGEGADAALDALADLLARDLRRGGAGECLLRRCGASMVATVHEAGFFADRCRAAGLPGAGVMVEIPAAALRAAALLEVVDFLSIGSGRCAGGYRRPRRADPGGDRRSPGVIQDHRK